MAMERDVALGGRTYRTHTVRTIEHNYDAGQTVAMVTSRGEGLPDHDQWVAWDLDESIGLERAYALLAGREEFAEVADEAAALEAQSALIADIAALLTDEQMAEVAGRLAEAGFAGLVREPDAGLQPVRPGGGAVSI